MKKTSWISVKTSIGEIRIFWTHKEETRQVLRVLLPGEIQESVPPDRIFPDNAGPIHDDIGLFCRNIREFLEGRTVKFSLHEVDLNICSAFQRKVLSETWKIPRGKVMSYGHLSEAIGVAGGARAVGTALAKNPFPLIIPCHRVIRRNGHLGGFGGGLKLKETLLEIEGVTCDPEGRVLRQYFWP